MRASTSACERCCAHNAQTVLASAFMLAALVGVASPASAQTATLTLDDAARTAFDAGHAAFVIGLYDDALRDFRRAYDLSSRPELLYNIGLAADRLRHDDEALDSFEAYLGALPEAENRPEVEARIRALRDAVASDQVSIAVAVDSARAEAAASTAPPAQHTPEIYEQWWFWTIIGVAVAAAVTIPIAVVAGSSTQVDAPVPGSVGPGGIVIALDSP